MGRGMGRPPLARAFIGCLTLAYMARVVVSSKLDNLEGRHLDITVIENENMVEIINKSTGQYKKNLAENCRGYMCEMIRAVAVLANFTFTLHPPSGRGKSCKHHDTGPRRDYDPYYARQYKCGEEDTYDLGLADAYWSDYYVTASRQLRNFFTVAFKEPNRGYTMVGQQPTNGQGSFSTMGELERLTLDGKVGNTCVEAGTASADDVKRTFPGLKLLHIQLSFLDSSYLRIRNSLNRPEAEDGCLVWILTYGQAKLYEKHLVDNGDCQKSSVSIVGESLQHSLAAMAVGVADPYVTQALSIGIQTLNTCAPTYDTEAGSACPLNTTQLDGRAWESGRDEHLRSHALSRSFEYWFGGDLKACRACALGTEGTIIKDSKGRNAPTCVACRPGFFSDTDKGSCQACRPGTFQPNRGSAECYSCFEGQFQSEVGSFRCITCADGKYSVTRGALKCVNCPSGHKCVEKDRQPVPCAKGAYALGNSKACVECSTGRYQDQMGQSDCKECPANQRCTSRSTHTEFCPSVSPGKSLGDVLHGAGLPWCLPNATCKFFCPDGSDLAGLSQHKVSDLNQCLQNGAWAVDPATKICVGQPCTKQVVLPPHSIANMSHCMGTPSGRSCTIECPEGYVRDFSAPRLECQLGQWQTISDQQVRQMRCLRSCGDVVPANMVSRFTLKHAKLAMCKNTPSFVPGTDFDGICSFECEPGMEVRKPALNQILCRGGKWKRTTSTGHCTPSPCRVQMLPTSIRNNVDVQHCELTESGQTCHYKCRDPSTHLPNPVNPFISCSNGQWQLNVGTSVSFGCVPACMDPPPVQLQINNAKLDMCARVPAANPSLNFTGVCDFICDEGMGVLAGSGEAIIRCDLGPGPPHWAKIGRTAGALGTGECTSTLCDISNERENLVHVQSFSQEYWEQRLPVNVDDAPTEVLNDWEICRNNSYVFRGTQPFRIGCCQKRIENENGTVIRSGLFPLKASGTCPRRDNWIPYLSSHDFYRCTKITYHTVYIYMPLMVVIILGILSSVMVLVMKMLFGSRKVFMKVQRAKNKIKKIKVRPQIVQQHRYEQQGLVAKEASRIAMQATARVENKIKRFKTMVSEGYTTVSYTVILQILLATLDICSDLMLIQSMSESHHRAGKNYMYAAISGLCSSVFFNFIFFFVIFDHASKRYKVKDEVWKELMCPWILLIAIPSLTNLNVLTLMPWIDRELQSHPTPCSYVTCMVLGFYGAIFQLTIAVSWWVEATKNSDGKVELVTLCEQFGL